MFGLTDWYFNLSIECFALANLLKEGEPATNLYGYWLHAVLKQEKHIMHAYIYQVALVCLMELTP